MTKTNTTMSRKDLILHHVRNGPIHRQTILNYLDNYYLGDYVDADVDDALQDLLKDDRLVFKDDAFHIPR